MTAARVITEPDVLRDIRNMLEQLGLTASSFAGSYKDGAGRLQRGKA